MAAITTRFCVLLILVVTLTGLASGQDSDLRLEPTGFVIEIHSNRPPGPVPIELRRDKSSGFWASGFPYLKDWKRSDTSEASQVLDFKANLIGDQGELVISLFRGKRFGEIIEKIARILISEGDTVVVSEMAKFGFEPITVKLLRKTTTVANVPLVSNPASLLRTTVIPIVSTLPKFYIKFHNETGKDIMAFDWHTEAGGRRLMTGLAQGKYGHVLIESSSSYEMNINARQNKGDTDLIKMVISAVIFKDGTVEGSTQAAETYFSFTEGRKKALDSLVPLLESASVGNSQRPDLAGLIARVDSLTDDFPKIDGNIYTTVGIAFESVITEAMQNLRKIDSESVGKPDSEKMAKLNEVAKFFREWQSRMAKQ